MKVVRGFESHLFRQRQSHVWCMARGYTLPGRLDPVNLELSPLLAPRKDGAAAGGIPLPEDGLTSTFEVCRAMSLPCKPDGA